jgi:alkylation response protein AidB-like acyl-CoA dehydrogenase
MTQALSIPDALSRAVDVSDIAGLDSDALRAELVRRANELVPLLERNATKTEADRRVVEANIDAIRAAGLFRIMVPRRFGGLETDMRTCLDVSRELAKGCGSTAWVTTLLNLCSWLTAHAGAEAQDEIWGHDGDARVAGVFTPSATARRVEGENGLGPAAASMPIGPLSASRSPTSKARWSIRASFSRQCGN